MLDPKEQPPRGSSPEIKLGDNFGSKADKSRAITAQKRSEKNVSIEEVAVTMDKGQLYKITYEKGKPIKKELLTSAARPESNLLELTTPENNPGVFSTEDIQIMFKEIVAEKSKKVSEAPKTKILAEEIAKKTKTELEKLVTTNKKLLEKNQAARKTDSSTIENLRTYLAKIETPEQIQRKIAQRPANQEKERALRDEIKGIQKKLRVKEDLAIFAGTRTPALEAVIAEIKKQLATKEKERGMLNSELIFPLSIEANEQNKKETEAIIAAKEERIRQRDDEARQLEENLSIALQILEGEGKPKVESAEPALENLNKPEKRKKWGPLPTNAYQALGLTVGATKDEINNAYKEKAKEYYPDLNPNNKAEADEWTKVINEARELLLNSNFVPSHFKGFTPSDDGTSKIKMEQSKKEVGGKRPENVIIPVVKSKEKKNVNTEGSDLNQDVPLTGTPTPSELVPSRKIRRPEIDVTLSGPTIIPQPVPSNDERIIKRGDTRIASNEITSLAPKAPPNVRMREDTRRTPEKFPQASENERIVLQGDRRIINITPPPPRPPRPAPPAYEPKPEASREEPRWKRFIKRWWKFGVAGVAVGAAGTYIGNKTSEKEDRPSIPAVSPAQLPQAPAVVNSFNPNFNPVINQVNSTEAVLEKLKQARLAEFEETQRELSKMKVRMAEIEAAAVAEKASKLAEEAKAKAEKEAREKAEKKPTAQMPGDNMVIINTPAPENPPIIRRSPYSYYAGDPIQTAPATSSNSDYGSRYGASKEVKAAKEPVSNPYHLSEVERAKADEKFTERIEKLFPVNTLNAWKKVKSQNAYEYINTPQGRHLRNTLGLPAGGIESKLTVDQFLKQISQKEVFDAR